jgi:hypothetical protein
VCVAFPWIFVCEYRLILFVLSFVLLLSSFMLLYFHSIFTLFLLIWQLPQCTVSIEIKKKKILPLSVFYSVRLFCWQGLQCVTYSMVMELYPPAWRTLAGCVVEAFWAGGRLVTKHNPDFHEIQGSRLNSIPFHETHPPFVWAC